MEGMIPRLRWSEKGRLSRNLRTCREHKLKTRYLIILNLVRGLSPTQIAALLSVSRSTVYNVAKRFSEQGEAGLIDRREDNGARKLSDEYLTKLNEVVRSSPQNHGWQRPTWTRELLALTLRKLTKVKVHVTTMSVALKQIKSRRGRPKPTVGCPWSKRAKNKRLKQIQALLPSVPRNEVVVYEDEVDIHLNPKIGLDWMGHGQQKEVLTPGKNEKRYLAGAQDARTGELIWVEGEKKNSVLFVRLLWQLLRHFKCAKVIHVILDNYSIHKTQQVELTLTSLQGQRLQLHFLPPYCPDHNKIERTWQDLHANVTRNHTCQEMNPLMRNVRNYLKKRNRTKTKTTKLAA